MCLHSIVTSIDLSIYLTPPPSLPLSDKQRRTAPLPFLRPAAHPCAHNTPPVTVCPRSADALTERPWAGAGGGGRERGARRRRGLCMCGQGRSTRMRGGGGKFTRQRGGGGVRGRSEAGGGSLATTLVTSEFVAPQLAREAVPQAREGEGRRRSASTNFFGSRGLVLGAPNGGGGGMRKRRGGLPTQRSEREEGDSGSSEVRGRLRSAAARRARHRGDTVRKRALWQLVGLRPKAHRLAALAAYVACCQGWGCGIARLTNAVTNAVLSLNDAMGTKAGFPASPVLTSEQVGAVWLKVLFSRSPRSSLTASCEVPRCMVRCNCRLAVVNTLGPKTPRVNGRERERERWFGAGKGIQSGI
jgi:hypothetical protein